MSFEKTLREIRITLKLKAVGLWFGMKLESDIKYKVEAKQEEKGMRWKAFRPVLDAKKCDQTCPSITFCPRQAIIVLNSKPKIDYDLCDGCLICLRECTHGAISEEKIF